MFRSCRVEKELATRTTALHDKRLDAVVALLRNRGARAVMDLGCGSGALIEQLLELPRLQCVVGLDRCPGALAAAHRRLGRGARRLDPRVTLRQGCLTAVGRTDGRFDVAVAVETLEHLHPHRLSVVERALFQRLRPRYVVITTPNADYNRVLGLADGERRHPEHRFEWGRRRFEAWSSGVAARNAFDVVFQAIGPIHAMYGSPSQMAVFHCRSSGVAAQMTRSNLEILAYEATELGPLCLRRRELLSSPGTVVTEITLDHQFLMSSLYTASEEALARVALEMHPGRELDVLVGGLGLGYTAEAALRSPRVRRALALELLPQVVEWMDADLLPLSPVLKEDVRFAVETTDAYARLLGPATEQWDLILIDIDHSPQDRLGGAEDVFYTEGGLSRVRRHLAPGGVLGVWSWAESSPFAHAMREVFEVVRVEPVTYFNRHVDEERTDWLFFGTDGSPAQAGG